MSRTSYYRQQVLILRKTDKSLFDWIISSCFLPKWKLNKLSLDKRRVNARTGSSVFHLQTIWSTAMTFEPFHLCVYWLFHFQVHTYMWVCLRYRTPAVDIGVFSPVGTLLNRQHPIPIVRAPRWIWFMVIPKHPGEDRDPDTGNVRAMARSLSTNM